MEKGHKCGQKRKNPWEAFNGKRRLRLSTQWSAALRIQPLMRSIIIPFHLVLPLSRM